MSAWVPFYAKKPEMPEPDRKDLPIQTRLPLGSQKIFQLDSDRTHPVMVLHKCSHLINEHDLMFELFKSDHRLRKVWTVLTFNGDGIRLYSSELVDDEIQLPGEGKKRRKKKNGEFSFKDVVGVSSVLQFLKENGGARRFGHIVIIAGRTAGRGINFVSQDFKWHLTAQVYVPSENTPAAELMQSMRLCGVYCDTIRPVLYSTSEVCENVTKALHLQEEMLARLRRHLGEQKFEQVHSLAGDEVVRKLLSEWLFAPLRVPTARLITATGEKGKKGEKGFVVKKSKTNDDGGVLPLEVLRRQLDAIEIKAIMQTAPGEEDGGSQRYLDKDPDADYLPEEDQQ